MNFGNRLAPPVPGSPGPLPRVDLDFEVTGVEPEVHGITPLIQFALKVSNPSPEIRIRGVSLHAQIQIQCPERAYSDREKEGLSDLFGTPNRWGQTLRNRLWAQVNLSVPSFAESVEVPLSVPCTFDLNVASAKYFHALEDGDVGILFLFSGTVFYIPPEGALQIDRISWNKECAYRMPVKAWKDLIDAHYPNSAWLYLDREAFDRLDAYKRREGLASWEQAIDRLLSVRETPAPNAKEASP